MAMNMTEDDVQKVISDAMANYSGNVQVLESAIGALHVGLKTGWRPLRLMHTHSTFSRYQRILGVDFLEVLPEVGPLADKSLGWRIVKVVGNFWDAARGTIPGRSTEFS